MGYQSDAKSLQQGLITLNSNLSSDAQAFSKIVTNLNTAVNGDNGVLAELTAEITSINGAIDGAIAGIVTGSLLIIGGAFVCAIGAVADFVTAGTSTPVVLGGVAMIATGAGGDAAGAVVLQNSLNARQALYQKQSYLSTEVVVAAQISHGYSGLQAQAANAVNAATQMYNAWTSLNSDLNSLIQDLNNGVTSGDAIRKLWLTAANTTVDTVVTDVSTIKSQMAGVTSVSATKETTIAGYYAEKLHARLYC